MPFVRERLSAFCSDMRVEAIAISDLEALPQGPFQFLLTGSRGIDANAEAARNSGALLIQIEDQQSATPPLMPLSRSRLRSALTTGMELVAPISASAGPEERPLSGHVLVVEDNRTNQLVVRLLLEKLGCTITVASDGSQAVQLCQIKHFDLILMDVQMPVMDGLEATRRLRMLPGPNGLVPIIALTANAMEDDRLRCLDAGMTGYLAKPVILEELLAALRIHIPETAAEAPPRAYSLDAERRV